MNTQPYFISLQGSYKQTEIALFKGEECIELLSESDKKASAELIPQLDALLKKYNLTFNDISFMALDQGPGAFTSLRVIITTANALAFASNKPLIGIDGIDALAFQTQALFAGKTPVHPTYFLVILNAFNNDVYYGLYKQAGEHLALCMSKSYANIDTLLNTIELEYSPPILICAGNAVELYQEKLETIFGSSRVNATVEKTVASAKQIGKMAFQDWKNKKNISSEVLPLYLKTQNFKPKFS